MNIMEVSDYNLWNYGLTEDQMIQWTSCKVHLKGNIVNWDTTTWRVPESAFETYAIHDANSMCNQANLGPTVFPEKFNAHETMNLCRKVNGEMFVIKDNRTQQIGIELIKRTECCKY
jgi:hypothetical protein